MALFLSIILIFTCIVSLFYKKYHILLFLLVLSLFNDVFDFNIGVALKLHHFIVLISLPKLFTYYFRDTDLRRTLKFIFLEFSLVIIMGIFFGFLFPFDDPYEKYRLFTQRPEMRAVISSVRLLLELMTIVLIVYWVKTQRVTMEMIIKTISVVLIINVAVALVDTFNGYFIKNLIYPNVRIISGRFTGLSGEPKAFGRYCAFGLIFLLFFSKTYHEKLRSRAIFLSIVGISLSLSASAILITLVGVALFLLSQRKVGMALSASIIVLIAFISLRSNTHFQNETIFKINTAMGLLENNNYMEKVTVNEPVFFSRFDVFDRAALNFLYNNPKHLILGVGPNLISTPASKYLTSTAASIYTEGINTAPGTYLIAVLSRTGIIGLLLNLLFFNYLFKRIKGRHEKFFFLTIWAMSLLVGTSLIYFFTAISIALLIERKHLTDYPNN